MNFKVSLLDRRYYFKIVNILVEREDDNGQVILLPHHAMHGSLLSLAQCLFK
jgi:hypothetical protein